MKRLYILSILLFSIYVQQSFAQSYATKAQSFINKYKQDFLEDANSLLKQDDLKNLDFYAPDSTYAITATVEILGDDKAFSMATFDGASKKYTRFAKLHFKLNGEDRQLVLYKSEALSLIPQYQDYIFLPFTDNTNGNSTYPGGRYIDLRLGDLQNGAVDIDFNKAYNPYCAYSDGYQCPVPPAENTLNTEVKAGEKLYKGEKKHQKN